MRSQSSAISSGTITADRFRLLLIKQTAPSDGADDSSSAPDQREHFLYMEYHRKCVLHLPAGKLTAENDIQIPVAAAELIKKLL